MKKVECAHCLIYVFFFFSEKVYIYGSNIAYEYRMDSPSAACSLKTLSVNTHTCTSSVAVSELAKDDHNPQESCELDVNQTSVIKAKSNSYGVTSQACQKCCVSETVNGIAENGSAENRSCRTTGSQESVTEKDPNTYDNAAENQMHAVIHESGEELFKKKIEWVNSYNSFDTDFKTKLHKELKLNGLCTAQQTLYNDEYNTSAAEFVQKWMSGHPSPERTVEGSPNIVNKNGHFPLECEEEFKVDNLDGFQVVGDTVKGGVFQTKTSIKDCRKPTVSKYTTNITPLTLNLPVTEGGAVLLGNSCNGHVCYESACCKGSRAFGSESDNKLKYCRTEDYCGAGSRYGFGRISASDVSSPELICEEEWIASKSCFVPSESTDYVTCDDTYPVVNMTGVGKEGQNAKCLESNISNPSGKVRHRTSSSSSLSSSSSPEYESADSFMSLSEEYKYSDEEGGVVLLERRFLVPTIW